MEEQLVSFETAKLAKDKLFYIKIKDYSRITGSGPFPSHNCKFYNWNDDLKEETAGGMTYISAPTQSLLQKWLREKHLIVVDITLSYHTSGWRYSIYKIHTIQGGLHQSDSRNSAEGINTYEGALELGLQKALNLINL